MKHVAMIVINAFTHDTRVEKEAKTLARQGYGVVIYALHGSGLPVHEIRDHYQVERIRVRSRGWGTHLFIRILKYIEFCVRVIYRIYRQHPDIIHSHDINALIPGFVVARISRAKIVYDAHELWVERQAPLLRSDLLRKGLGAIEGLLARGADAVITVNPSIAKFLQDQLGLSGAPTVLMHCQEYQEVQRNNILREEFDISDDQRIIIYPGLFAEGRGLEQLIEAVPHLDRAVVVLMGRDQLSCRLHTLVQQNNLEDRVFIRQPVPTHEVARYVASADIGVMPTQSIDLSYHYGAGNKLFHYMMAGIPSAVSNQPEKRRVVEGHGVGTVFDQTDPKDIASTINALLNDSEKYQRMCLQAKRIAQERFNWRVESRKLTDLYSELMVDI